MLQALAEQTVSTPISDLVKHLPFHLTLLQRVACEPRINPSVSAWTALLAVVFLLTLLVSQSQLAFLSEHHNCLPFQGITFLMHFVVHAEIWLCAKHG